MNIDECQAKLVILQNKGCTFHAVHQLHINPDWPLKLWCAAPSYHHLVVFVCIGKNTHS